LTAERLSIYRIWPPDRFLVYPQARKKQDGVETTDQKTRSNEK
jgi:hypothetical protein